MRSPSRRVLCSRHEEESEGRNAVLGTSELSRCPLSNERSKCEASFTGETFACRIIWHCVANSNTHKEMYLRK